MTRELGSEDFTDREHPFSATQLILAKIELPQSVLST
jgi:hypothetical protein